jgi:uncharacterized membrane protein
VEYIEEAAVVGLIVLASAVYSLWRLTSARFHLRVIDSLGAVLGNPPWLANLHQNALKKVSGGCGSCASNTSPRKVRPLR